MTKKTRRRNRIIYLPFYLCLQLVLSERKTRKWVTLPPDGTNLEMAFKSLFTVQRSLMMTKRQQQEIIETEKYLSRMQQTIFMWGVRVSGRVFVDS